MSSLQALLMGILQGLTEFFPVSSSAHLKLAKIFFGIESSEAQVYFDLSCHLGTLVAVLYFLRKEILHILKEDRRKFSLLFIATLPLIPCYFFLKPLRDFASHPQYLGFCLLITAVILFLGQKLRIPSAPSLGFKKQVKDVLWIGTMQSAALIPGISRSASTISCAHVLGWTAQDAVRFSFLLSIPTIIGGNCLELLKISLSHDAVHIPFSACAIGFFSSCSIGLMTIGYAIRFLEKGKLVPFAWYCLALGIAATIYLNFFAKLPHG